MEKDLTIIFLTASEIKESFAKYQRKVLLEAVGDYPIISVSRKPLKLGKNIIDDGERGVSNIYRQMLRAAKIATTPYIAIAEDDTLYHENHFNFHRPPMDTFCYDQNRFALFTWGEPIYSWRNRKSNASLIAPRELLIEALEERFKKWPDGTPSKLTGEVGRGRIERNLGISERKSEEKFGEVSLIQFNHDNASEQRQTNHRKRLGQIKAYDLYHWGHAKELRKHYEG
jgi:hypothetical protein